MRNSGGRYSFGPCTGVQLQLTDGEVMASKDGSNYEPFKAWETHAIESTPVSTTKEIKDFKET